jgi:pimeloyl-ACP methyl ester carboxylesterase
MGWLSEPAEGRGDIGVLVLPAVGYQYWSAHRTLRVLAERLAASGHLVLRLDYDGTGDSAGEQSDPGRITAWRSSVLAGAEELRILGARRLVVVGIRLGGTLALLEGAAVEADAIVALAPIVSGRRYARELRMLSVPVPGERPGQEDGAVAVAGTLFSAETIADLSAMDALEIDRAPSPRVLLIGEAGKLADRLRELGSDVEQSIIPGGETALELPTEEATVPTEIVAAVERWVGREAGVPHSFRAAASRVASFAWGAERIEERLLTLGAERLVAISSDPVAPSASSASPTTAVFLNTGSEAHVGPGRAWVELARGLAARGDRAVRVDFRGWGESPDDGYAPGRPYDPHCEQDSVAIVRALREQGHERIVLVGLCASAWVALRTALHEPLAGVIALNPQLYWQPGDPVEATMAETRLRRTDERERERRGGKIGLWSALDHAGLRPWAGRWLDELSRCGTPVTLVYAAGDDGIEYLRNRLRRRLEQVGRSGRIAVLEVPDIDHSMHRVWLRPRMLDVLHERLSALEP